MKLGNIFQCKCGYTYPMCLEMGPRERKRIIFKCTNCDSKFQVSVRSVPTFRLEIVSVEEAPTEETLVS